MIEKNRLFGLDVVRTLAIGAVLLCHTSLLSAALFPPSLTLDIAATLLGYYGVELFFVLSGFLIGSILMTEVVPNPSFRSARRFLLRRWLRILPAYYAVLLLLTGMDWVRGIPLDLHWTYLLLVQNYNQGAIGFFPVSWSLTIEHWSYLLAPVVLLILPRLFSPLKSPLYRRIWFSLLALFTLVLALRFGTALLTEASWDMDIRKQIHLRLDAVFFGIMVISLRHTAWKKYHRLASLPAFLAVLAALAALISLQADWMLTHQAPAGPDGSFFFQTFGFTLTNFLLALTLPFFAEHRIFPLLAGRCPRLLHLFTTGSRYAYSLYLVHFTIFAWLAPMLTVYHAGPLPWRILNFMAGTVVAFFIAWMAAKGLYRFVEKPGMDLRRFLPQT